jgi:hypothetical protein
MTIFGYFDSADQTKPAFDPGLGVDCPFCGAPLDIGEPRRTISFMRMARGRSYFYRAHSVCADAATPEQEAAVESWLIDKPERG